MRVQPSTGTRTGRKEDHPNSASVACDGQLKGITGCHTGAMCSGVLNKPLRGGRGAENRSTPDHEVITVYDVHEPRAGAPAARIDRGRLITPNAVSQLSNACNSVQSESGAQSSKPL